MISVEPKNLGAELYADMADRVLQYMIRFERDKRRPRFHEAREIYDVEYQRLLKLALDHAERR